MDIVEIKTRLARDVESVARDLLPNGRKRGNEWRAGDVDGDEGDSLGVHLVGPKAGIWSDFATGEGGAICSTCTALSKAPELSKLSSGQKSGIATARDIRTLG